MPSQSPETAAKASIQHGLRAMGFRVIRMQSGQVKVRGGFMHLCPNGTPDLLAFDRDGVLLWVEVKAALGKASADQRAFAEWAHSVGHRYCLARTMGDVLAVLS